MPILQVLELRRHGVTQCSACQSFWPRPCPRRKFLARAGGPLPVLRGLLRVIWRWLVAGSEVIQLELADDGACGVVTPEPPWSVRAGAGDVDQPCQVVVADRVWFF
jgi:hypothetical protein